jgi:hypothetical protein
MGAGPDLLDLGERELEGGIDPVEDLAPPHEVGAVHDADARCHLAAAEPWPRAPCLPSLGRRVARLCGTTFRNGSTRNGRAVCGFLEFCSRQVTLSTKLTADSFRYDGHCETSGGLVWRRGGDRTREFEMTPLSRRQVEPRLKSWMPFLAGGPAASRGHVLIGRYAERAVDGPVLVLLVGRP